jgi:glucosamine-6-phosphate deaminase
MNENLFNHINIKKENCHFPSETNAEQYDALIDAAGGIDIQLLGIGVNGHIGFNEPGTEFDSKTHRCELSESTRLSNVIYFDHDLKQVPTHCVTMGIGTILKARNIIMLAFGEAKKEIIKKLISEPKNTQIPATALHDHAQTQVILDKPAAAAIPAEQDKLMSNRNRATSLTATYRK